MTLSLLKMCLSEEPRVTLTRRISLSCIQGIDCHLNDWPKVHLYLTRDQLWLTQSCHDMDGVVLAVEVDCIDQDEETGKKTPEVFFRLQKNTGGVLSFTWSRFRIV